GIAGGEDLRERQLDGRSDRKVGIGDEFKAVEGGGVMWAIRDDPAELELREPAKFGESGHAEGEGFCGWIFGRLDETVFEESVFKKNLVDQDGDVALGADRLETIRFVGLEVRAGGVVGIDDDDGSGAVGDDGFECGEVDVPGAVVTEGILADVDGFERGEEFE